LQLLQHLLLRRARVQPLGNPHTDVDANGHCNSQRNTNTDSYSEIYSYIQAAPSSTTSADPAVEKAVIFWEHRLPACPFRQPAEKLRALATEVSSRPLGCRRQAACDYRVAACAPRHSR